MKSAPTSQLIACKERSRLQDVTMRVTTEALSPQNNQIWTVKRSHEQQWEEQKWCLHKIPKVTTFNVFWHGHWMINEDSGVTRPGDTDDCAENKANDCVNNLIHNRVELLSNVVVAWCNIVFGLTRSRWVAINGFVVLHMSKFRDEGGERSSATSPAFFSPGCRWGRMSGGQGWWQQVTVALHPVPRLGTGCES